MAKELPALTSQSQPHAGTPEHPGGQRDWMRACIGYDRSCGDDRDEPGYDWVTILVGRDSGKALDVDTEVPTPTGWKRMGDLVAGDVLFSETGERCRVLFAHPVMHDRACYEVEFSDGTKIVADADHLWTVDTKKSRKAERRNAAYRKSHALTRAPRGSRLGPQTLTTEAMSRDVHVRYGKRLEANYSINVAGAVECDEADLPIDPYVLGVWLGDGTSRTGQITCDDPDIVEEIRRRDVEIHRQKTKFMYGMNGMKAQLRALNLLQNKHIPAAYMNASARQRRELLCGLMDTDGSILASGVCEFSQSAPALARQVRDLVNSLGMKATINRNKSSLTGYVCEDRYRVAFVPRGDVFRLSRKRARQREAHRHLGRSGARYIVGIRPVESRPVRCITVDSPSKLYLVSRSYIATHNTVFLYFLFMEEGARCTHDYICAYVGQTHARATEFYRWCLALWEAAGLVVDKCNDGQDRWIKLRPFGRNRGFTCYFWSGEPGAIEALRGQRLDRLGIDEPGYVSQKVLPTCIPMMNTRAGKAVAVGTARRDGMGFGWFLDMFNNGNGLAADPNNPLLLGLRFKSFNVPSESNPFNPPAAYVTLPTGERILKNRLLFRSRNAPYVKTPEEREEFDGAFITDLGACFTNLDAVFSIKQWSVEGTLLVAEPPTFGERYVIGQDWAARDDHSVSSVFSRRTRRQVALRIEPSGKNVQITEQLGRLDALKKKYNDALIVADGNAVGLYISEQMRRRYGDGVRDCNLQFSGENAKGTHVARVRHFCEEARWRLMDHPEQREQFTVFRQEPLGPHSNGFRYCAPSGKKDDIVLAGLYASTVLEFDEREAPTMTKEPAFMSRDWFAQQAAAKKKTSSIFVIGGRR